MSYHIRALVIKHDTPLVVFHCDTYVDPKYNKCEIDYGLNFIPLSSGPRRPINSYRQRIYDIHTSSTYVG